MLKLVRFPSPLVRLHLSKQKLKIFTQVSLYIHKFYSTLSTLNKQDILTSMNTIQHILQILLPPQFFTLFTKNHYKKVTYSIFICQNILKINHISNLRINLLYDSGLQMSGPPAPFLRTQKK